MQSNVRTLNTPEARKVNNYIKLGVYSIVACEAKYNNFLLVLVNPSLAATCTGIYILVVSALPTGVHRVLRHYACM
jgi:hypothetical protein